MEVSDSKETLRSGYIHILDISPEVLKTDIPVVISPGWSENPKVFEKVIAELNQSGRRVVALSYSGVGITKRKTDYPSIEVSKGEAILDVLSHKGIPKVDIVGHSEGAIGAILAASFEPKKVGSLILVTPAGLVGKDTFPKIFGRFSTKMIRDHRDLLKTLDYRPLKEPKRAEASALAGYLKEGYKYVLKNPITGLREAIAISQFDLQNELKELHDLGIKIAIVASVDDLLFPMNRLQSAVNSGDIDGFISVKGGHEEIHLQENYGKAIDEVLSGLDKRE
jgi:pimeloyl-ACP methyl ester carboxylesterase